MVINIYDNLSQYPPSIAKENRSVDLLSHLLNASEWSTCENMELYMLLFVHLRVLNLSIRGSLEGLTQPLWI